jgi:hypothetical protein
VDQAGKVGKAGREDSVGLGALVDLVDSEDQEDLEDREDKQDQDKEDSVAVNLDQVRAHKEGNSTKEAKASNGVPVACKASNGAQAETLTKEPSTLTSSRFANKSGKAFDDYTHMRYN